MNHSTKLLFVGECVEDLYTGKYPEATARAMADSYNKRINDAMADPLNPQEGTALLHSTLD